MNKRIKLLFSVLMVFTLVVLAACGNDTKDAGDKETGADGAGKS